MGVTFQVQMFFTTEPTMASAVLTVILQTKLQTNHTAQDNTGHYKPGWRDQNGQTRARA